MKVKLKAFHKNILPQLTTTQSVGKAYIGRYIYIGIKEPIYDLIRLVTGIRGNVFISVVWGTLIGAVRKLCPQNKIFWNI